MRNATAAPVSCCLVPSSKIVLRITSEWQAMRMAFAPRGGVSVLAATSSVSRMQSELGEQERSRLFRAGAVVVALDLGDGLLPDSESELVE
jgi:hypothetical protein